MTTLNQLDTEKYQQKANPKLVVVPSDKIEPKKPGYIRMVCISDTHNLCKPSMVPDGDILVHCGDFTMEGTLKEIYKFSEYMDALPHKDKIIVAGNHDIGVDFARYEKSKMFWPKNAHTFTKDNYMEICKILNKYTYLENTGVTLYGYKFWGNPYITKLTGFAFNEIEKILVEKFAGIPKDTEILLTHSPPYSIADFCVQGCPLGSKSLYNKIMELKSLQYSIFGHNHEGHGHYVLNGKHFINCALVDHNYDTNQKPIVIDLPSK